MAEKYLYFRSQATDTSDDDANDSVCYPASSLVGMAPGSRTTVVLRFRPLTRGVPPPSVLHEDNLDNNDTVTLTVTTETQAATMKAITNAIVGENFPSFLVIANDDSGSPEYLTGSTITSCTIGTKADYADVSGTDPVVVSAAGVTLDSSTNIELNADSGTINFKDASASLGTITSAGYTGNLVGTVMTASQPNIDEIGEAADSISINGQIITTESTAASMPRLRLYNFANDDTSPLLQFYNYRINSSYQPGQDGDELGNLKFYGTDSASNTGQQYAGIVVTIHDATHTEESGKMELKVAQHNGTVTSGLILQGGSVANEIDVTIGVGVESQTVVQGDLTVVGDKFMMQNLPTSNPGGSGLFWSDGGTIKIT